MTGKRDAEKGLEALAAFLRDQRWFGEKGREIRSVTVANVIPVQWPDGETKYHVARVQVTTDEGNAFYQLFLKEGDATFGDALEDTAFRRGLVDAFAAGASFEHGGARWIIESESEKPFVAPPATPIVLSSGEQSNSSLFIGNEAVLKLFRKLAPGVHPDLEVTRFLTIERRFIHTPVLLGSVHFADSGGVSVAGMLQELVPGAVDGWTYALECSRAFFHAGRTDDPLPFEKEAEQLGAVTRAMHEALASGDPGSEFELLGATGDDVRRWTTNASEMIDRATRALERAAADKKLPRERVAEALAVAEKRRGYLGWMGDFANEIGADAGSATRIHGDYHLGQVLHSVSDRFLVIDFEGEPARPLAERRARSSPLRDVAGMLRSFSYAAATGGQMGRDTPTSSPHSNHIRAARWERGTRDAFLRGYFGADTSQRQILPGSRNNAARLIALFEAEKVFYELQYELDHRPEWVWIPLRGIAKLYS